MTKKAKEQYAIMADLMDKREVLYQALTDFVVKNNDIVPPRYEDDWETWTRMERRMSWRTKPMVIARMKRAARKAARAG